MTETNTRRFCSGSGSGCTSIVFAVNGIQYNRVCDRVVGYQFNSLNAFRSYYHDQSRTVDDIYIDGVSLTYGKFPHSHIWTFTCAIDETHSDNSVCPCIKTDSAYTGAVPLFIGRDYFCDTGS